MENSLMLHSPVFRLQYFSVVLFCLVLGATLMGLGGCSSDEKMPDSRAHEPDALNLYDRGVVASLMEQYDELESVPLSDLYAPLREIIIERNDCYARHPSMERRNLCRKQYSRDVFFTARRNIRSAPSKGFFMMCVRLCPITFALCQGEQHLRDPDLPELDCTIREAQCLESCMDEHWRGATHISSEAYDRGF